MSIYEEDLWCIFFDQINDQVVNPLCFFFWKLQAKLTMVTSVLCTIGPHVVWKMNEQRFVDLLKRGRLTVECNLDTQAKEK